MAETKDPAHFMYFPGHYRWSAAFIDMMGTIAYGGADIGELHERRREEERHHDDRLRHRGAPSPRQGAGRRDIRAKSR
jgi:hypothetical protein